MNTLQGKIAVITGGTQGLGAATAHHFAKAGAAGIVICGRNIEKGRAVAQSIKGCKTVFMRADLAVIEDCKAVIDTAAAKFGRVDCLVNAGATTARGGILDTDPDLFDAMFAINVKGPFFMTQAAVKLMLDTQTKGSIVNIGSMSAHCGQSYLTPYSMSKGAIATMTRNVAASTRYDQIRVNALNIGWMQSDQEKELHAAQGHGEDWFEERAATLPFKRLLQPDEVARAIGFLCSDDSGMMTGEVINFDQTIWGATD